MASPMMTFRFLGRTIIARHAVRASPGPQRTFTTSRAWLNNHVNANANGNPSYPTFSLKHISSNPRTRYALVAALLTLGFIEGAAWVKFGPKIMGKGGDEAQK